MSLQTWLGKIGSIYPCGWTIYTSSFNTPWRKAFRTSSCLRGQLNWTARDKIILILGGLITRLKVSSKSIPYCWWNPLATSLALYLLMLPSLLCFNLKTHLQPTTFCVGEGGTKTQVPCLVRASNSSSIVVHHFLYLVATLNDRGSMMV